MSTQVSLLLAGLLIALAPPPATQRATAPAAAAIRKTASTRASFLEDCRYALDPARPVDVAAKVTVTAVMKAAGTTTCEDTASKLVLLETLDLAHSAEPTRITDLTPLRGLGRLKTLSLV